MLKYGSHEIFENVCHVERIVNFEFPVSNLEILKSVEIGNLVGKCDWKSESKALEAKHLRSNIFLESQFVD